MPPGSECSSAMLLLRNNRRPQADFPKCAPAATDRLATARCATRPGARQHPRGGAASIRRNGKANTVTIKPVLDPDGSEALRDQLLTDLDRLNSADAAAWAHQIMAAKNSLVAADARLVEDAFAAKIAILSSGEGEVINAPSSSPETSQPRLPQNPRAAKAGVDKSLLALPEPRRFRDKTHCKFVAKQPCLICGRKPSDAHHLRFAQHPALGRKVSDEFVVPLCRGHHREVHRSGDEASWWSKGRIDPIGAARKLWTETQARTPARSKRLARSPAQPPRGGYPPQNF